MDTISPLGQTTGSFGSTASWFRVPPQTVTELAKLDWHRVGKRVVVDPQIGIFSWLTPSSAHEQYAFTAGEVIQRGCEMMGRRVVPLLGTRWKQSPEDPDQTGMEADSSFYIGTSAEGWYAARKDGRAAVEAFEARTPPDLIVEVEWTKFDEEKASRWRAIGVRELWRGERYGDGIVVEIIALQTEGGPTSAEETVFFPSIDSQQLGRLLEEGEREGFTAIEGDLENLLGHPQIPEQAGH